MSAANVMISKLGGLTTFEALACRANHRRPDNRTMPQEAGTANLIEERAPESCKAFDRRGICRAAHDGAPSPHSRLRAATAGLAILTQPDR